MLNQVGVPSSGCLLANDAAAAAVEADDELVVLVCRVCRRTRRSACWRTLG
ncbi:hypothetical protein JG688_00006108 [Phytophthora aleatoria]|uniref:Uncharacterized protein n=1 Tax=Phytophthora aleatoria TaxID=2496075 RepID=A0A8J5MH91_9STRA|nr:hypothetical protein JG688_00006108 [Phytophthora aleatoria]